MVLPVADSRFFSSQVQISNSIRRFWVDMIRLFRLYITRTLLNLGTPHIKDSISMRLNRAVDELQVLLLQYYGEDIANQVHADFLEFIYHLQKMIEAYASRDENAIVKQRNTLFLLANKYAQSFALMNNYYDKNTIQELYYAFISSVENQVVSIMNEDYERDLDEYEKFMDVGLRLADEFAYGMLRQFIAPE